MKKLTTEETETTGSVLTETAIKKQVDGRREVLSLFKMNGPQLAAYLQLSGR